MGVHAPVIVRDLTSQVCSKTFRRQSNNARYKCMEKKNMGTIRSNPMFKLLQIVPE